MMTEKDKEINELRRENERLNKTNTILLQAMTNLVVEYNKMLAAIQQHSANIKHLLEGLK